MQINKVFVSVNAKDFAKQSEWWSNLLDSKWTHEPMPSCHEWVLAGCVLFQVLDNPKESKRVTVTLHVESLDRQIKRLKALGIDVPKPEPVPGFKSLRYTQFQDPEGNQVGLLDGK